MKKGQPGLPTTGITDAEVVQAIRTMGMVKAAQSLGIGLRGLNSRRRRIEQRNNLTIEVPQQSGNGAAFRYGEHHGRIYREVKDGVVLVGGDNHYEPGLVPVMHRAFVMLCKEFKPKGVILNGDLCDFARLGKYPAIGWEHRHAVVDEIESVKDRLAEIEQATFKAWKDWPLGNHDSRFNTALANDPKGKEYAKIHGTSLKDHFPNWSPCWATWLNQGTPSFTIIQHRNLGGQYDAYRNAKENGCHYVTGHTHHPYVMPYTNAVQDVYGVNHGCIANTDQQIFVNWTEGRPLNWRSAFAVLTYRNGLLMPPELANKLDDDHFWFRGEVIRV